MMYCTGNKHQKTSAEEFVSFSGHGKRIAISDTPHTSWPCFLLWKGVSYHKRSTVNTSFSAHELNCYVFKIIILVAFKISSVLLDNFPKLAKLWQLGEVVSIGKVLENRALEAVAVGALNNGPTQC